MPQTFWQRLCGNQVTSRWQTVYTGLFNERGGFESDLTLFAWPRRFYLVPARAVCRRFDWIARNVHRDEHSQL